MIAKAIILIFDGDTVGGSLKFDCEHGMKRPNAYSTPISEEIAWQKCSGQSGLLLYSDSKQCNEVCPGIRYDRSLSIQ